MPYKKYHVSKLILKNNAPQTKRLAGYFCIIDMIFSLKRMSRYISTIPAAIPLPIATSVSPVTEHDFIKQELNSIKKPTTAIRMAVIRGKIINNSTNSVRRSNTLILGLTEEIINRAPVISNMTSMIVSNTFIISYYCIKTGNHNLFLSVNKLLFFRCCFCSFG